MSTKAGEVHTELVIYKKTDEPLWMELEIVPVDYLGRGLTHWVSVSRDITDKKSPRTRSSIWRFTTCSPS